MRPAFLDEMSWSMAEVYGAVTDRILINLARYFPYVKPGEELPGSFEYQARMLAQMGQVNRETADIILQSLGGADAALRGALETAILEALKSEEPALRKAAEQGLLGSFIPPEVSPGQMQAFKSYYAQSADKLNLVNTVMLESTESAYRATVADITASIQRTQNILNTAAGEVVTGVTSWNQAMRDGVRRMVENGLTGFVDHGGHRWSPEAYVAMDIRTTMFNTAREAVDERARDYGADLYQVSSHNGARPLCYPWQGKVISRSGWTGTVEDLDGNKVTVHSEDEIESFRWGGGLFGVNCRHYPMNFIPGFSTIKGEPQDPEENEQAYAESQQQRALERRLREEKRDLEVMQAQGADPEAIKAQRAKVKQASADIDKFCEDTGRARRRNREATPVDAKWPKAETYDATQFPTEQRGRINDWFANGGNGNPPQSPMQAVTDSTPPQMQKRADFTPASTIAEAEEAAKKFVSAKMGTVSYKGIDLEYANTCNRVLGDIDRTFGLDALGSIQPMNMRSKLFKGSTSEAAYRWGGIGGDLYINPTYYKSAKAFAEHKAEIDRLTQVVLDGGEMLRSRATGRKLEYIEALLNTKRQCVSQSYDFVEGTFVHECGHALDDKLFRKRIMEAFGGRISYNDALSESRHTYGGGISGYAVADNQEYIAESFAAWWFGEGDKLDPAIRAIFEGAIK